MSTLLSTHWRRHTLAGLACLCLAFAPTVLAQAEDVAEGEPTTAPAESATENTPTTAPATPPGIAPPRAI
ncbi:MAG: hypothetical protein R3336_09130, partial [Phycisphaeraceae bacterium]|nr:hypothetical protein [Phycisphaeraceae bacterium]